MKASEIITVLSRAIEKHGDLEVLQESKPGKYTGVRYVFADPMEIIDTGEKKIALEIGEE